VYHSGMITLVHGTWPRGLFGLSKSKSLWFVRGSPFRQDLERLLKGASLDCEIRDVDWSGANSVFARDKGAIALARLLEGDLSNNATPIVIAHSHGANVALRAMKHLGADASRVRIVTLAAPFLRVFVRKSMDLRTILVFWPLVAAIGGIFWLFFAALSVWIWSAMDEFTGSSAGRGPPDSWLFAAMAAGAVTAIVVTWFFINGWNGRASKIVRAVNYGTRRDSTPRMLVIRGVEDEASLSLWAAAIGSRLSHIAVFSVVPWIYVPGFFLSLFLNVLFRGNPMVESLMMAVMVVSAFGALAFFVLLGLFKSVFGREFLIGTMRCDITVDSVPDTLQRIEAITLKPQTGTPRHQIYSHPQCVNEIVRWLTNAKSAAGT